MTAEASNAMSDLTPMHLGQFLHEALAPIIANAQKAEADRKAAEASAERDRVLAVEAEWRRQEDQRHAKDRAHRADIHGQIARDIDAALQEDLLPGLDHLPAVERIVAAIANGKVRHVTVNY